MLLLQVLLMATLHDAGWQCPVSSCRLHSSSWLKPTAACRGRLHPCCVAAGVAGEVHLIKQDMRKHACFKTTGAWLDMLQHAHLSNRSSAARQPLQGFTHSRTPAAVSLHSSKPEPGGAHLHEVEWCCVDLGQAAA